MIKSVVLLLPVLAFFFTVASSAPSVGASEASWTLLIFMNAKNNLEADALDNFAEISGIGSTQQVNVLVEIGRPTSHVPDAPQDWSGVLRFRVTKGQDPKPENAAVDLRGKPELSDLGSTKALQDFIDWGIRNFPAKHYMLVIWNHGQGWRFQVASDLSIRATAASSDKFASPEVQADLLDSIPKTPQLGGFRAVSFDQDTGHFLYNSDIQQVVETTVASLKRPLDVVGFDACLMSMLESAYAFRNAAALLVSSEELEPGAGWDYAFVLRRLNSKPGMSRLELTRNVVEGYKARYGDYHSTTMSVIDLSKIPILAKSVSHVSDELISKDSNQHSAVAVARQKMISFGAGGGLRTSIDLSGFLTALSSSSTDEDIQIAVNDAQQRIRDAVLANYASARSAKSTISKGIAIYFPANPADFQADPYHDGYLKNNTDHVVQFVSMEHWADFLQMYLRQ